MQNGMMLQGFSWYLPADGQHWNRLARLAPQLAHMGITAVWLPPAYKSFEAATGVGYGVYDLWDLGEFDQCGSVRTKYGTKQEYLATIKALQREGIQVLADVVLNQRFGGDEREQVRACEVDPDDRTKQLGEERDISAWTRYSFPGRGDRYSDFHWDWTCFHGTDWDESARKSSIYLFSGKHWDDDVDHSDNKNYDYLMGSDVDVNDSRVFKELISWGQWYLKETGVDGLRLDALKHISRSFYRSWLAAMRAAAGREVFTVGEYWSGDVKALVDYLGDDKPMSLFDVPLHYKLFFASNSWGALDLSRIFDDTLVSVDPVHAVTFVDNHDTQPRQALQSTVESWFKPSAYMLILLRAAGYPCVFYADLFSATGDELPTVHELPLLMEIRQRLSYGEQRDYFNNPSLIGWTREGDDTHSASGLAVVITDAKGGTKRMLVGKRHAGETFSCVVGQEGSVEIDEDGYGEFATPAGCGSVYVCADAAATLEHDKLVRSAEEFICEAPSPRTGAQPASVNTAPYTQRHPQ